MRPQGAVSTPRRPHAGRVNLEHRGAGGAGLPRPAHRAGRRRGRRRRAGRADVPAGRSTGSHEAHELRDGGTRFGGYGVRQAVANVNDRIAPALIGRPAAPQRELDAALLELDGTDDKSALGANAILGVSLAAARAAAAAHGMPLYRYVNANAHVLPAPQVNLINGGRHASNDLDFQEFIVIPSGAESMLHALQISTEINLQLGEILLQRFGKAALNTGDEGGYAPAITDPREALELPARGGRPRRVRRPSSPTASTAPRPTSTTARPRPTRSRARATTAPG